MINGKFLLGILLILASNVPTNAQSNHSVARRWNEALLQGIRKDLARPTVHARNLFHTSVVMYDAWAVYDRKAETWLLDKKVGDYQSSFNGIAHPEDIMAAQSEAISYAAYRLLIHRFKNSPGAGISLPKFDALMDELKYDKHFESTDYSTGSPAALGNYIAQQMIAFGLQDGSNEEENYASLYYEPINPILLPTSTNTPELVDPNRWQPLGFDVFIDQSGYEYPGSVPTFVSPEWGNVIPFGLQSTDLNIYERDGHQWRVYHDPGPPPYINLESEDEISREHKWNFELVAVWSGHMDPADGVMWDISPSSIGNVQELSETLADYHNFYDLEGGGDSGQGYDINPKTNMPYSPQFVARADYTRVLAEFWADGPNSETPPGHWFSILNYVNDHPLFEKRFEGKGPIMDDLEWDVKTYFALGGAVHDAAVTVWGIKGYYDYIRPISAIRSMCKRGQCTDSNLPNYNIGGIDLRPGFVELVQPGDPLAGSNDENVGKIKLYAWKGPEFVVNPATDVAGVGWILAENWWPYQRPTFVTPPFAGYISGHSTFSRAAAELLTLLTGDPYFPGGMSELRAPKNEFLVFEDGPSTDITLQWAKYVDASDQCSLSRIWGGIHPPADDIPGRKIGKVIGVNAFHLAKTYFAGLVTSIDSESTSETRSTRIYPNPVTSGNSLTVEFNLGASGVVAEFYNPMLQKVFTQSVGTVTKKDLINISTTQFPPGLYFLRITGGGFEKSQRILIVY